MRDERELRGDIGWCNLWTGKAEIWGRKASTAHAIPL